MLWALLTTELFHPLARHDLLTALKRYIETMAPLSQGMDLVARIGRMRRLSAIVEELNRAIPL